MVESRFRVEVCRFNTIFGTFEATGSSPAGKWPRGSKSQTRYAAKLYNVDVRQDQRYMVELD
jgi:hypothetical protein